MNVDNKKRYHKIMDVIHKIAGRHFNYAPKGGLSCTCPGCAGSTRTRISELVGFVDRDSRARPRRERSRRGAKKLAEVKRVLLRRAKRKESRFVMRETLARM